MKKKSSVLKKKSSDSNAFSNPQALVRILREISTEMMKAQSQLKSIKSADAESDHHRVLAHWMSIVLVSGNGVKLTFKTHFMTKLALRLASKIYQKTPETLSEEQGLDFMREYCNLCAGLMKRLFLVADMRTGVSIPVVTRGFDEIFFPKISDVNSVHDCWIVDCGIGQFYCTTITEFTQEVDLSKFNVTIKQLQSTDDGSVEFL